MRRGRNWLIVLLVVVGAVAIAGIAAALIANGTSGSVTASSPTTTSPSPVIVPAPTALHAAPGSFRVVLTWKQGSGAPAAHRYFVYRNGSLAGIVDAPAHRLVDGDVLPAQSYRYEVEAEDVDGHSSTRASVSVETEAAPLVAARLAGVFDVRLTKTSSYGVTGIASKDTAGWRFTPACDEGPCDVDLKDVHFKQLTMNLVRTLASYAGSATIKGFLVCSGTPSTSSYKLTLHVTDAEALRQAWLATALEGTVTIYDSPQLGCRSSGITYAVRATLVH